MTWGQLVHNLIFLSVRQTAGEDSGLCTRHAARRDLLKLSYHALSVCLFPCEVLLESKELIAAWILYSGMYLWAHVMTRVIWKQLCQAEDWELSAWCWHARKNSIALYQKKSRLQSGAHRGSDESGRAAKLQSEHLNKQPMHLASCLGVKGIAPIFKRKSFPRCT